MLVTYIGIIEKIPFLQVCSRILSDHIIYIIVKDQIHVFAASVTCDIGLGVIFVILFRGNDHTGHIIRCDCLGHRHILCQFRNYIFIFYISTLVRLFRLIIISCNRCKSVIGVNVISTSKDQYHQKCDHTS